MLLLLCGLWCVGGCVNHSTCATVRGQLCDISSLLPVFVGSGIKLRPLTCTENTVSTETSGWPRNTENAFYMCLNLSKNQINKMYFKGILEGLPRISSLDSSWYDLYYSLCWESDHMGESHSLWSQTTVTFGLVSQYLLAPVGSDYELASMVLSVIHHLWARCLN